MTAMPKEIAAASPPQVNERTAAARDLRTVQSSLVAIGETPTANTYTQRLNGRETAALSTLFGERGGANRPRSGIRTHTCE